MKKITSVILSVIMVFGIFTVIPFNASALTSGDYEYEVLEDNTVSITGYNGSETDVVLPTQIDGYDVSTIATRSFANKQLDTLTISNGIKKN